MAVPKFPNKQQCKMRFNYRFSIQEDGPILGVGVRHVSHGWSVDTAVVRCIVCARVDGNFVVRVTEIMF